MSAEAERQIRKLARTMRDRFTVLIEKQSSDPEARLLFSDPSTVRVLKVRIRRLMDKPELTATDLLNLASVAFLIASSMMFLENGGSTHGRRKQEADEW